MSDNHEGETMGPEHHEYCNKRMLRGRPCDCGLDALCAENTRLREALEAISTGAPDAPSNLAICIARAALRVEP